MQLELNEAEECSSARAAMTPRICACSTRGGLSKGGYIGKEAGTAYALCEQVLAIVAQQCPRRQALVKLDVGAVQRFQRPERRPARSRWNWSSKALASTPDLDLAGRVKGIILGSKATRGSQGRARARTRAGPGQRGRRCEWHGHIDLGEFEKVLTIDRAILASCPTRRSTIGMQQGVANSGSRIMTGRSNWLARRS